MKQNAPSILEQVQAFCPGGQSWKRFEGDNPDLFDAQTLESSQYDLSARLWLAFSAGWRAAKQDSSQAPKKSAP